MNEVSILLRDGCTIPIHAREEVCFDGDDGRWVGGGGLVWEGVSGLYYREERGVMNHARHSPGPVIHGHT